MTSSAFLSRTATFPGGSKSRVNRAGDAVREGTATNDDIRVIDEWRAAHRAVLNTFQALLRNRTRSTAVSVAQRHKRRTTIYDKLNRLEGMKLARMDDIAGCRLIFPDLASLHAFRDDFLNARFNHKRKNDIDKYDYIKRPKSTGYRGIHDIYSYDVNSDIGRPLKGLLIEIQYRTLVQHAWATAVEVIGFVTESQPKFERGDTRYQDAMALASEVLARVHENTLGPFPDLDNGEVVRRFLSLDQEIGLVKMLKGLNSVDSEFSANRNSILIISPDGNLKIQSFRDATDALRRLFELERDNAESDIVLVRADTTEEIRLAFKNYFSDATEFVRLLEDGCYKLSRRKRKPKAV